MNSADFLVTLVIGALGFAALATLIGLVDYYTRRRELLRFGPRL